jgi:hypothetical protein
MFRAWFLAPLLLAILIVMPLVALAEEAKDSPTSPPNVAQAFETAYAKWDASRREIIGIRSDFDTKAVFDDNKAWRELVALGVPAVPYMIAGVQEDPWLGGAIHEITKHIWHVRREGDGPRAWVWKVEEYPDIASKGGPPDSRELWLRWWQQERHRAPERLATLRSEWRSQVAAGKDKEAKETRQRIVDIGIAALPAMQKMIAQGDTDLIPIVSELTDGKVSKSASKEACATWWAENKEKWTLPPAAKTELCPTPDRRRLAR